MVSVYADIDFSGAALDVSADIPDLRASGPWNDFVSSVKVPAGATVTLYQDINYGGLSLVLTSDASDLRQFPGPGPDGTWNDQASSIKVSGAAQGGFRLTREIGGLKHYIESNATGTALGFPTSPSDKGLVSIVLQPDGFYLVTFVSTNVPLTVEPDGSLTTRPAGAYGAYQQLLATTQPNGRNLLYREDAGGVLGAPLTIEEAA